MRSTHRPETITVSGVTGTVPPNGPHNQPTGYPHDPSTGWQQPPFYLNQIAPPQPPKGWPGWKISLLIAAICLPLIAGILVFMAAVDEEPAKPTGIGTPAPYDDLPEQRTSAGAKDSAGAKACAAVKASNEGPSPFSQPPAAMAAIAVDGMNSSNPFIQAAARELRDVARAAVDAKGSDPMSGIKMGTAALNLQTTCIEQWYYNAPK